jgi:hypothetical protein
MEKVAQGVPRFIEKAGPRRSARRTPKALWEFFITWGQYGFNKSHAVCYSVIGYACAWLKHHYPLEWWTAVLRNASKNEINEKFWRYCGHLIDLPDVKLSGQLRDPGRPHPRAAVAAPRRRARRPTSSSSRGTPRTPTSTTSAAKIEKHRLAKRTGETAKVVKPEKVDPALWDIGPLRRFQMRKDILPAYGADLLPLLLDLQVPGLFQSDYGPMVRWSSPYSDRVMNLAVVGANDVERTERTALLDGHPVQLAVAAYVEDTRVFSYGEDRRQACEVQLDVEGARFKFVKWGGKAGVIPELFKGALKGAVAMAVLTKYKADRPFALDDLIVVQHPLDHNNPEPKQKDEEDEADDRSNPE